MEPLLASFAWSCELLIFLLLRFAVAIHDAKLLVPRRLRGWRRSIRRLLRDWLARAGRLPPPRFPRRSIPWNRTPGFREEQLVRLHLDFPHLGAGQLRWLILRLFGWLPARETVRQIILRRDDLRLRILRDRRPRRRIRVPGPRKLWAVDLALVWVLGFFPVWLLGAVDFHGSRLVALEVLHWPSSACVVRALQRAIEREGPPERLLSDRGPYFRSEAFSLFLAAHGVRHVLTLPCHPWTNGRVERIWRTFRQTLRHHFWLVSSRRHLERICADFTLWYNRDRPHSAWRGRTPDEVYFGRSQLPVLPAIERVSYFDGRLNWFRFG